MCVSVLERLFGDAVTAAITVSLVIAQLLLLARVSRATFAPRARRLREIRRASLLIEKSTDVKLIQDLPLEIQRAYGMAYVSSDTEEPVDLETAFGAERLLPPDYNVRLDTAAPGLFTAIGILGTFLGLLVAFYQIDFSNPAESIKPLIAGMRTAFINSLFGVAISVWWTYQSRQARHDFDTAASALWRSFEIKFGRPARGGQVLGALAKLAALLADTNSRIEGLYELQDQSSSHLAGKIGVLLESNTKGQDRLAGSLLAVEHAVSSSSANLLNSLAPRLEESFKSLVDMPFDRLSTSVDQFREMLQEISRSHVTTLTALDESAKSLALAHKGLGTALEEAEKFVATFGVANRQLQEQVDSAAAIVGQSREAATSLQLSANSLETVSKTHSTLTRALELGVHELERTSSSLAAASDAFNLAAGRLEGAVGSIQSLGPETASASLEALQKGLDDTVRRFSESLTSFGDRNVAAYEQSTGRVVQVVDNRTSDLTDRMSAELSTLARRLPEATSEISQAVKSMNVQLQRAVATLQQSVRTLDTGTTETLAARLKAYDEMVARAVDHFNGTLMTWGGRVEELTSAVASLRDSQASPQGEANSSRGSTGSRQ